jgi:hypothetical protein
MSAPKKSRKRFELLLVSPGGNRVPSRSWATRKAAERAAAEMRSRYQWDARVQECLL